MMRLLVIFCVFYPCSVQADDFHLAKPGHVVLTELQAFQGSAPSPEQLHEEKLLEKASKHRLNPKLPTLTVEEMIELLIYSSGKSKPEEILQYTQQFSTLYRQAEIACKDAKTVAEKGEKLMAFLHQGIFAKGYDEAQSLFTVTFDTKKYNCVSSSVIYFFVAKKLGLEIEGVSIPGSSLGVGHAACDLLDGKTRYQVEPTNPDGFDWGTKIKRPNVVLPGGQPDRTKGILIDALGMLCLHYSNRGVMISQGKDPNLHAAIRCYTAAICLNPADKTAQNNLESGFVNWGPQLAQQQLYTHAIEAQAFGHAILPKSNLVKNNLLVIFQDIILLHLRQGKQSTALQFIRRAKALFPEDSNFTTAIPYLSRHAHQLKRDGKVQSGWQYLVDAEVVVTAMEKKLLRDTQMSYLRIWSQDALSEGGVQESFTALKLGWKLQSDHEELTAGIGYHTEKSLYIQFDKKGMDGALAHLQELRQAFTKSTSVEEIGASFARRKLQDLAKGQSFESQEKQIQSFRPFFADAKIFDGLREDFYEAWGNELRNQGKWQAGFEHYCKGIQLIKDASLLRNNVLVYVDDWAKTKMNQQQWQEAIAIYDIALKQFPESGHLQQNRKYCQSKLDKQ